ncbi:hypothetical protein AHiyo8_35500 [Arthrobacter sp. Hiyo8]|nr:hypothetical protein AHiyo8_35500 [Arthrobacter sp. Hiyo8]
MVLVVVSYILSVVAGVVTFLLASPMFANFGLDLGWNTDGVLYSVFTGGLYVSGVALIGLSLGTLLKNPAGGITVLVGIMFVLPFAGQFLSFAPGTSGSTSPSTCPVKPAAASCRSATSTAPWIRGRAASCSLATSSCSWFLPSLRSRSGTSDSQSLDLRSMDNLSAQGH